MACSVDQFQKLHDQAVEAMTAMNVALSTKNYMIWYNDAAGDHPDLSLMLRQISARGETFNNALCQQLYERFFGHEQHIKSIEGTCSRIEKTVEGILLRLGSAKKESHDYSETLSTFQQQLAEDSAIGQMRDLLQEVLSETQQMQESATALGADLAASTTEIAELNENLAETSHQSEIDKLTGIANRRRLESEFASVSRESESEGFLICLLMIDIDHFKNFNNTHGHQLGDRVLKLVAETLIKCTKGSDLAVRYGGEEFAVLLPRTDLAGAMAVADHIREAVAKSRLRRKVDGQDLGYITLSGGCTEYQPGEDFDAFMERAIEGLNKAKRLGRNRIQLIR